MNRTLVATWVAIVVAALGLSFAGQAWGADDKAPAKKGGTITGAIEAVDATARTLKVKGDTEEMTFQVAKDAKFVVGDKKDATLADFKAGDKVRVDYDATGGNPIAQQITLMGATIPPAAPPLGDPPDKG